VDAQTSTTRNPLESGNRYNPYIEKVWDLVWGKRVVYFAHLFFGLGLLAAPWLLDFFDKYRSSSEINCEGRSCLLNEPLDAIGATVNSFLPFGLTTEPWIASAKAYTGWVLPLALIWIVFYVVGMRQKKAVNTTLAQYWLALAGKANPPAEIKKPSKIYQLRSSQKYQQAFLGLKQYFLPWAWAGVLIFGATYGVNQASIYVRDHSIAELAYCSPADDKRQFAHVDTRKLCNDTGFDVVKGGLYEIAIAADIGCKIPEAKENDLWRDLTIPASASGVKPADRSYFAEAVGLAFKRSTSKKFFSPIIQLSNTFPEFPELTEHERWITDEGRIAPRWRFVATKTGRAYYYVNDGIIGFLPKSWQWFYQNNCGTGKLQLVKLS